jgi:hypothetical protein
LQVKILEADGQCPHWQCEVKLAWVEPGEAKTGILSQSQYIAGSDLDLHATVRTGIELIALAQRQVERRLVPVALRLPDALIADLPGNQTDAGDEISCDIATGPR